MDKIEELLNYLTTTGLTAEEKILTLANLCSEYINIGDTDNALKYAALSTICTNYPTAFACCLMGDAYHSIGNLNWAERWYMDAMSKVVSPVTIGSEVGFFSWIPLTKLAIIAYERGDMQHAMEYLSAAKILNPDIKDTDVFDTNCEN